MNVKLELLVREALSYSSAVPPRTKFTKIDRITKKMGMTFQRP